MNISSYLFIICLLLAPVHPEFTLCSNVPHTAHPVTNLVSELPEAELLPWM